MTRETDRPLHVVYLCGEYPPAPHGGIGTFTRMLARRLVAAGQRVTVLGIEAGREHDAREDDEGVVVRRLAAARTRPRIPQHALRLRRALREIDAERPIDLIEGAENGHALALPGSSTRSGPGGDEPWSRVVRMHGGHRFFAEAEERDPALLRSWLERRSLRRADRLCAVSHYVAERTRALLDLGGRPIEVIPNPVDVERFRPSERPPVAGRVAFAGALVEKKGIRQLIQAAPRVAREIPDFHLVICGRDTRDRRGSFRALLEAETPEPLRERVEFRGAVPHDEIATVLASAEVLAYPSHMEAMPLAWLEGMALAKPVLASSTGPGPEVIEHEVSGLLCDPRDPTAIADGLIRLLRDAPLRQRLGEAARRRAVEHFSIEVLAERNLAYYREIARAGH
ncbi:MAG: glycosyltransferase family 1 protein [Acidobacteria bacterium]|nr:MAG: glycosyltransferase family 1 protein [Acidobacteriota bacterium]REK07288.1 MAG: glycosyltransferase family 1 protein [Acidobacteriota bacterium]